MRTRRDQSLPKALGDGKWSRWSDSNRRPAVYETAALPLSYTGLQSPRRDSNPGPQSYQDCALPPELRGPRLDTQGVYRCVSFAARSPLCSHRHTAIRSLPCHTGTLRSPSFSSSPKCSSVIVRLVPTRRDGGSRQNHQATTPALGALPARIVSHRPPPAPPNQKRQPLPESRHGVTT